MMNSFTGGSINFKPGTKLLIKTFNNAKNNSASQPAGSGRNNSIPTFSKRGRRLMDSPEYKGPSNSGVNNNTNTKHEAKEDTQRKRGRKMDLVALAAQKRYLKAKSLLSNRRGDISIGGIDVPKRTGGYFRENTAVKSDEGIKMSTKNAIVVIDDENENTGGSGSRSASSTVDFTRKQKGSTYFDPIEIT
ncbi:hypothetical protein AX774_g7885 [Zancudomyces culisetae]|uniref:Uncharacterized protein n=1 Tax=Zancudomyces culisetae TaxID=1213189 RepID=A0A1R1PCL7_ZANCU|nr:hypothetical protein AX774_g7885 [Zancudomyces culisetae]|eukprot:OMH78716.1 hypothetical protein AX774_g7885 [Zancudomyces culisetae]